MRDDITKNKSGYLSAVNLTVNCLLLLLVFGLSQSCTIVTPIYTDGIVDNIKGIERTIYISNLDPEISTKAVERMEITNGIRHLDIFIFNNDEQKKLDSYYHIKNPIYSRQTVLTGEGDKLAIVIANLPEYMVKMEDIASFDNLEEIRMDLRKEDPEYPVMSGETGFSAGNEYYAALRLTPLLSNVRLDFLNCNFSGRGYKSKTLEDACVYLTNVSSQSEIMRLNSFTVNDVINSIGFDETSMLDMTHPEMLCSKVTPGSWKAVNLYCYPNDHSLDILGSSPTKMVIQGIIDGVTYYYPIEINQKGFGYSSGPYGIGRNIRYSYSINITRKGSLSPDVPVDIEEMVTKGSISVEPGQFISGQVGDRINIRCEVYPDGTEVEICREDLDYDVERGIYSYVIEDDGRSVCLDLKNKGTGMFIIEAGQPVNDSLLVMVVVY